MQTIGAILLTGNSRQGGATGEFNANGEPVVRVYVRNLLENGIDDIVVVLGRDRWRVAAALTGLPVCLAVNEHPERGMAESIRIGVAVMPKYVTNIMVAQCDLPLIVPEKKREWKGIKLPVLQPSFQSLAPAAMRG